MNYSIEQNVLRYFWWGFVLFGVLSISILSLRYSSLDVIGLLNLKSESLLDNSLYRAIFYVHITGGIIALSSGVSQFWEKFRSKNLKFHRTLGKIYIYSIFISSIAGLVVAQFAYGGIISIIGFSILAIIWFSSTYLAFKHILKKEIEAHRVWMIRSYAITFSAVTLRIWLLVYPMFGLEFIDGYRIAAWLCWGLNILVIETYLKIKSRNSPANLT